MNDTDPRPMLANARAAADEFLMRKVADGSMDPRIAKDMAAAGFTVTTRVLSCLRVQDGMSEADITAAYQGKLAQALAADDKLSAVTAEFTLTVWDGMQADLAAYLRGTGTEQR